MNIRMLMSSEGRPSRRTRHAVLEGWPPPARCCTPLASTASLGSLPRCAPCGIASWPSHLLCRCRQHLCGRRVPGRRAEDIGTLTASCARITGLEDSVERNTDEMQARPATARALCGRVGGSTSRQAAGGQVGRRWAGGVHAGARVRRRVGGPGGPGP